MSNIKTAPDHPKPPHTNGRGSNDVLAAATPATAKPPIRLDQLEQLLSAPGGASIAEMVEATGWQQHSVRGAMAGALKRKRGLTITSEKIDGVRRYRAEKPA
jgi:hypothetical protein